MNEVELKAFGMTLQMCVMVGDMNEQDAVAELEKQYAYAKAVDEVSK